MQYESVILELMSRIKTLETSYEALEGQVAALEEQVDRLGQEAAPGDGEEGPSHPGRRRMTESMIQRCYRGGVRLYREQGADLRGEAREIVRETGMNENSAIMYICAVQRMLQGTVYKRAINAAATACYFDWIRRDFGDDFLRRAVAAARAHIAYRQDCGHPVDGLEALCDDYEKSCKKSGDTP